MKIKTKAQNGSIDVSADDSENSFDFKPSNSWDLYLSLHSVNAGLSGKQSADGKWNLQVNISDQ